jgi:hypothetical protein
MIIFRSSGAANGSELDDTGVYVQVFPTADFFFYIESICKPGVD